MSPLIPIKVGMLLRDGPGAMVLGDVMRVLDLDGTDDAILLIPCRHQPDTGPAGIQGHEEQRSVLVQEPGTEAVRAKSKYRTYVRGPKIWSLSEMSAHVESGRVLASPRPQIKMIADKDLLDAARTENERRRILNRLKIRDFRLRVVQFVLQDATGAVRRPLNIRRGRQEGQRIQQVAAELKVNVTSVYKWVHLYWAGGSVANALMSDHDRCGAPGRPKEQRRPLGRKAKSDANIPEGESKYILTADCKAKLAHAYALIGPQVTEKEAFGIAMSCFWAEHVEDPTNGRTEARWLPHWKRPTYPQFVRWGRIGTGKTVSQLVTPPREWERRQRARGGSEQDMVAAFGQQGAFDGTSTDVYLARAKNRLLKLPPLTRLVLRETRLGIIYGFHVSWDPPSPATAALAILCGADARKDIWIKQRFDLDIAEDAIPGLLCRNVLADNGELKAHAATEGERQFGYSITYTLTHSGEGKGGVESSHSAAHRAVDHKLPGTTRGRPRKRGELAPVVDGLLTYYEYMRELIKYIVAHNTEQEVPHLAPDDFLLAEPPMRPTRLNILRWLRRHGLDVSLDPDFASMQAILLPEWPAVIRANGLYLKATIEGYSVVVPRMRFTGPALIATGLMAKVKREGRVIDVKVRMDPSDTSRVYLPHPGGLLCLENAFQDETIKRNFTLHEWIAHVSERRVRRLATPDQGMERATNRDLERQATVQTAKAELAEQFAKTGKRPSLRQLKSNLTENVRSESEALKSLGIIPNLARPSKEKAQVDPSHSSSMDDVMEQYYRKSGPESHQEQE